MLKVISKSNSEGEIKWSLSRSAMCLCMPAHMCARLVPVSLRFRSCIFPIMGRAMLHDYIFEWGEDGKGCAMALGLIPLYNHSYESNCEYEMDFDKQVITIRSVKAIKAGEELFINYNGVHDNETPLWFDAE